MTPPTLTRAQAVAIAKDHQLTDNVIVIGIRDHANKINVYDDTIAILTPAHCISYNANTDPSVSRPGVATLQPGVYNYKKGLHGIHHLTGSAEDQHILAQLYATGVDYPPIAGRILPYWALRQDGPVMLLRGGQTAPEQDGWPSEPAWIDIHKGGYNTTSSLGCQTIFPDYWDGFRDMIFDAMRDYNQSTVKYCLVQG